MIVYRDLDSTVSLVISENLLSICTYLDVRIALLAIARDGGLLRGIGQGGARASNN